MGKLWSVAAVLVFVGVSYVHADVIPILGPSEGHLKDLSNHFITPPQGGPAVPAPVPATLPNVGDELRSIYRLDDLQVVGTGQSYWYNKVTTGDEVTGLLYDMKVSRLVDLDNDGSTDIVFYTPAGRNPLTAADDKDGDIVNFSGAWGGVVELYADPSPDLDAFLSGGAGPGLWAAGGGPLRPNGVTNADGYLTASDGGLWLSGVLLDLWVLGDPEAQAGEVYRLTRTGNSTYAGNGYVNVFDGSVAPYLTGLGQSGDAALVNVSLAITVTLDQNVWGNPNWQAGSSDPAVFQAVPEPATLLLVGLGASVMGVIRRRRS